jgi:hypothetical protein
MEVCSHGSTDQPSSDMAKGRLSTPAPTMAVTLWKAAYHHLAFLLELIARQSSATGGFSGGLHRPSCESVRPLLGARARLASCRGLIQEWAAQTQAARVPMWLEHKNMVRNWRWDMAVPWLESSHRRDIVASPWPPAGWLEHWPRRRRAMGKEQRRQTMPASRLYRTRVSSRNESSSSSTDAFADDDPDRGLGSGEPARVSCVVPWEASDRHPTAWVTAVDIRLSVFHLLFEFR